MSQIGFNEVEFQHLIENHSGPVVMLNLLKFRQAAEGEEGTGAEAYARYGYAVVKLIEERGGRVLWSGRAERCLSAMPLTIGMRCHSWSIRVRALFSK